MKCRDVGCLEAKSIEGRFLLPKYAHMEAEIDSISIVSPPPDLLLARAVHDAKLPLQMILCEIRLMEDILGELPSGVPEACRNRCTSVFGNCYRMLRLINHLSDDVLVRSGRNVLRMAACELRGTLSALYGSVRDYAARCGIVLRFDPPDTEIVVWADREKIDRMALNYLSNAIKYTQRGGEVTLGLRKVGDFAEISVTDNGVGVPERFVPYLFERYRTIAADSCRGTGLGLSIVREFSRLHGGEAFYEPAKTGGSRFSFCIPLSDADPPVVRNAFRTEPDYIKIEMAEVL